jgi:hypothetical protein
VQRLRRQSTQHGARRLPSPSSLQCVVRARVCVLNLPHHNARRMGAPAWPASSL